MLIIISFQIWLVLQSSSGSHKPKTLKLLNRKKGFHLKKFINSYKLVKIFTFIHSFIFYTSTLNPTSKRLLTRRLWAQGGVQPEQGANLLQGNRTHTPGN